jgi:hypothetical protein
MNLGALIGKYKKLDKRIHYVVDLCVFILEYGIVTNIVMAALFAAPFTPLNIVAFGFIWYMLEEEVPKIKKKWKTTEE